MEKGMIKVSVLYPNGEGKNFDMDYYCNQHVSLVGELLGNAVKAATVEKGIGGAIPGSAATYAAMGNLYFASMDSFQNSFGPNAEKIMGDLHNFTNIEPIVQISEVML
ncbi:EthD family reductase [Arenibacter sp. M-2]|uniref:EthD family reductase n=1 Tax=Arenibacter sp. M-2 TaxID=3053612 RepID=UPI002570866E|nr:EthD family reductase [Arenibacter sp. M-2]MDL5512749.1 EthD family reductase [Arenibacter sp. M-2]|tara:strand:- start:140 stop:463 length:324 start_codon:yes stop_codon:yes gene_type:complete